MNFGAATTEVKAVKWRDIYANCIEDLANLLPVAVVLGRVLGILRSEWSPIRSVITRVITKSDDRAAGVRFVYHEYDYRPNWTTRSLITN